MFTGIVQGIRKISRVIDLEGCRRLLIELDDLTVNLKQGASVAVNGVCLTAVTIEKKFVEFDIIQESLNKSNLSSLKVGDYVNIERACCLGDEIGGHQINGHIDCTGKIKKIIKTKNNHELVVSCSKKWLTYLFPKGWIAVDGISLTVVDLGEDWFSIALIPETIKQTILGLKKKGNSVNLEFDYSTKVIVESINRIVPEIKEIIMERIKD